MANVSEMQNKAEKTRTVFIPRKNKNDTERYVAVNGENMLVQTGRAIELPIRFAEVIEASQRQDSAAEAFIEAFAKN